MAGAAERDGAERWLPVTGYQGVYQDSYRVSDQGHVKSLDREVGGRENSRRIVKGKLLSPRIRRDGTRAVNLWHGNRYRQLPVRRLVLEAFTHPQPPGFDAVNINENPADNRLVNLRWEPVGGLALLRRALGR